MCRKNQLLGVAVAAFGLGLLIGCFFESGFFCGCVGIALTVAGVVLMKRK